MANQIKKQAEGIERLLATLSSGKNPKRPLSIRETAQGLTACYLNALALLDDARLLAANRRESRSLSLTILALEELAKVPDLHDHYVNPMTSNDTNAWADFWRRWSHHKPKQERIAAYGNFLRDSANLEEAVLNNPTPYASYLNERVYGHRDKVKQRNFYVDFANTRFRRPESDKETSAALDFLFAFAEERADSFGSWHVTAERSLDFLSANIAALSTSAAAKSLDIGFNNWASTHEPIEAAADLLRLLCYHSSTFVPNSFGFYPECGKLLSKRIRSERITLVRRVVASLEQRMKIGPLSRSRARAYLMLKLLLGYSTDHFSDTEQKDLFRSVA